MLDAAATAPRPAAACRLRALMLITLLKTRCYGDDICARYALMMVRGSALLCCDGKDINIFTTTKYYDQQMSLMRRVDAGCCFYDTRRWLARHFHTLCDDATHRDERAHAERVTRELLR